MKKLILIFCFSLLALFGKAQTWEPVGAGIDEYPAAVSHWLGITTVSALCEYHGRLYIGGRFVYSGKKKVNSLACWDGKKIDTVGRGVDSCVFTLLPYKNYLCIGGWFTKRAPNRTAGEGIILWRDTVGTWTAMDDAFGSYMYWYVVNSLIVFKENLYVGMGFEYEKASAQGIVKWNGTAWERVGDIIKFTRTEAGGLEGRVQAMVEYNGKLYAGGAFHLKNPDRLHYMASWDGKKWNEVGKIKENDPNNYAYGRLDCDRGVYSLTTYKGYLYAGGMFDTIAGKNSRGIVRWNDTIWSGIGNVHGTIYAMVVYDDKLYVGGAFDAISGKPCRNIACWDGKEWSAVGDGLISSTTNINKGRVAALAVYKNELYAGGYFNFSGKTPLNNLAKISLNGQKKTISKKK